MVTSYKRSNYCDETTIAIFDKMNEMDVQYGNQPIRYIFNRISSFCDFCKKDYFNLSEKDMNKYLNELEKNNIAQSTASLYFRGFGFVNQFVKEHADELDPELINQADFGNAISVDVFRKHFKISPKRSTEDLIGMVFGNLKVVGYIESSTDMTGGRANKWECECSCGAHIITSRSYLQNKIITDCGNKKVHSKKRIEDLSGQIFDDFKVLSIVPPAPNKRVSWECECTNCGSKRIIESRALKGKFANRCPKCKTK